MKGYYQRRFWLFMLMYCAVLAVLLLAASAVRAQGVGLELKEVSVSSFAQAVLKGVLGRDYVLSPEVVSTEKRVSLSVKDMPKEKALDFAKSVLGTVGISVVDREGVLVLSPAVSAVAAKEGPAFLSTAGAPMVGAAQIGQADGSKPVPVGEVKVYWPRHRSVEFLSAVVKVAGGTVAQMAGAGQGAAGGGLDALIYTGSDEALEKIAALLDQVDKAMGVVSIKAAVLEVTQSSESTRSLSGVVSLLSGKLGLVYEAGAKAVNAISLKTKGLSAVLSAVDGDSRFRYVAEPSLRVVDGEQALLTVGSEAPVRGQVAYDKSGNTIQAVDYRTAGVVLNVKPRILRDSIMLKIGQQISSFAVTTTSNIDSPTVLKRQSETVIDARDGEVIVLAGLDESREVESSSGLSWVPRFLQSDSRGANRSQIVLLLEVNRIKN